MNPVQFKYIFYFNTIHSPYSFHGKRVEKDAVSNCDGINIHLKLLKNISSDKKREP